MIRDTPVELASQRGGRRVVALGESRRCRRAGCVPGRHDGASASPSTTKQPRVDVTPPARGGGHALAGQRRGVDGQRVHAVQPQVRRDAVTLGEQHQVADHEILGGDLHRDAVAHDGGLAGQEIAQLLGGVLGPLLLREREQPVEHDHHEHRDAELRHAGHEGQPAGHPEQQREEVHHLGGEQPPGRHFALRGQRVGAVSCQAPRRFGRGQSARPGHRRGLRRGAWGCRRVQPTATRPQWNTRLRRAPLPRRTVRPLLQAPSA